MPSFSKVIPAFTKALFKKEKSDKILCPSKALLPINSDSSVSISPSSGALFTSACVICVICIILSGRRHLGLTKEENVSVILPFSTSTAPISIILSSFTRRPVISKSSATYSSGIAYFPPLPDAFFFVEIPQDGQTSFKKQSAHFGVGALQISRPS